MRIKSTLTVLAVSALLLTGCAGSSEPEIAVEVQVQNCMNDFLAYAAGNFPDDPKLNPENEEFDQFITQLQAQCEKDQKNDPSGFYDMYAYPTENETSITG